MSYQKVEKKHENYMYNNGIRDRVSINTLDRPSRDIIYISINTRLISRATLDRHLDRHSIESRKSTNFCRSAIECRSILAVTHFPCRSTRGRRIDRCLMVGCRRHVGGMSIARRWPVGDISLLLEIIFLSSIPAQTWWLAVSTHPVSWNWMTICLA